LPAPTLDVQVRLPNGVMLDMRIADLDEAAKLIEVLGRLRCSASTKP
jgi:transposase